MEYAIITILLIIGFTYIVIRFISIKKQLKKIKIQINKKERINIILNDKDVEKIAESFNIVLQEQKQLEINIRSRESIEIQGEEVVCSRIIQNLVSNAIKYSTGYISIELREFDEYVIFKIRNSVSDLTQDDLKYLFDRFYTVDKSRNRSGSGLGLFIVKVLLDKIDGEVYEVSLSDGILSISILFRYL